MGTIAELQAHLPEALADKAKALKDDGYVIESTSLGGKKTTIITSKTQKGVLYGVFHFIRLMQTGTSIAALQFAEEPAVDLRMLNHWDNFDRSIERGYAGKSLWKWDELPGTIDPRYREYARFCATVDDMAETWMGLEGKIDANTHASVMGKLKEEQEYARLWRKTCLTFFAEIAGKSQAAKPAKPTGKE